VEDDESVTLITIRNKNKGERLEAIKALLNRILDILRNEDQIDKKSYATIKKVLK